MGSPIDRCLKKIRRIFYDFEINIAYLPQHNKIGLYVFFEEKLISDITWPVEQLSEDNLFETVEWAMNNHIINFMNIETERWIEKYYPNRIKDYEPPQKQEWYEIR